MKTFLFLFLTANAFADCVPPIDNSVTAPEFEYCDSTAEKYQYDPVVAQELIFEEREGELFVIGESPYISTHKEIEEDPR